MVKTGVALIADERQRQIEKEGWTPEHDQQHVISELAMAAVCYAIPDEYRDEELISDVWPWDRHWYKPTPDNRIQELTKAGALIAAEIDRIMRETGEIATDNPETCIFGNVNTDNCCQCQLTANCSDKQRLGQPIGRVFRYKSYV